MLELSDIGQQFAKTYLITGLLKPIYPNIRVNMVADIFYPEKLLKTEYLVIIMG